MRTMMTMLLTMIVDLPFLGSIEMFFKKMMHSEKMHYLRTFFFVCLIWRFYELYIVDFYFEGPLQRSINRDG